MNIIQNFGPTMNFGSDSMASDWMNAEASTGVSFFIYF